DRGRTEAARRGRRRVAQETGDAVEDVAPFEESAEDLRVARVNPLAAGLPGVPAADDRVAVFQLDARHQLVDVGPEEERIAETERREVGIGAHRGVGRHVRVDGGSRAVLARVGEGKLLQLVRPEDQLQGGAGDFELSRTY